MLIAVPQKLNFGLCLPGPRRETFNCQQMPRMERAACNHRRASRGVVQNPASGLWPAGATVQVVKSCKTITGSAKNPDVGA